MNTLFAKEKRQFLYGLTFQKAALTTCNEKHVFGTQKVMHFKVRVPCQKCVLTLCVSQKRKKEKKKDCHGYMVIRFF